MKRILILLVLGLNIQSCTSQSNKPMVFKKLTIEEERVILHKGTERPYTGQYDKFFESGTYHCKQCNSALYRSTDKFDSGCGWPAFDDEILGAITRHTDADGRRTEIVCASCGGHLGHVFAGERLTDKNTRHCVNSISMTFVPSIRASITDTAIFAAGCFWGVQYYFEQIEGVKSTLVGYTGGTVKNPSYKEVCNHTTGHLEAIEVVYDPQKVSFEKLCQYFFEIHDFSQTDGQGPDIGPQYLSAVFYKTEEQKKIANKIIKSLSQKGYAVATKLIKSDLFWKAEDYHQLYYHKNGKAPYCHRWRKIF